MKTIEVTVCCVAIFLTIIHKAVQVDIRTDLNEMSKPNAGLVDGMFKAEHLIGVLPYALVYKGILNSSPEKKQVAMKFYPPEHEEDAKHEYTMYTYLNAINNPAVEPYGIPSVYYYGHWKKHNYTMLAITLVDFSFEDIIRGQVKCKAFDVVIMFQGFVRVSKYMHSRGIAHQDIGVNNLMFRTNQVFIIDFNVAVDVYKSKTANEPPLVQKDWAGFLNSMHDIVKDHLDWLQFNETDAQELKDRDAFLNRLMEDAKKPTRFIGLRKIFIEFYNYAYNKFPWNVKVLHDHLYKSIEHEMGRYSHSKQPLFSWVERLVDSKAQKKIENSTPSISSIDGPFGMVDPKYPEVKFDYFIKLRKPRSSSSSKSKIRSRKRNV